MRARRSTRDPREAENRQALGLAPQSIALYEEISSADNLRFFGRLHGLKGPDLEERVAACLDFADLTDVRKKSVSKYSGGMKRRLNLAVAIVHDPDLVLLDEPTVGVDPQSRNAIFDRVEQLRDDGKQIVYTTHYMEEAQRLCDRVAIMDRGRLMALDSVRALIEAHGGPGKLAVQTGDKESIHDTTDPLGTLAQLQERETVEHFQYRPPDLETVFLNLTGRALRRLTAIGPPGEPREQDRRDGCEGHPDPLPGQAGLLLHGLLPADDGDLLRGDVREPEPGGRRTSPSPSSTRTGPPVPSASSPGSMPPAGSNSSSSRASRPLSRCAVARPQ